ncbi:uncharacterized protein LOC115044116 [Echeneis naucrates]|uniref:Uncharacterized LOC115044116 n=1 Tax=Echeneis naucrates TaxID=173247 RepID=A0A665VHM1_ECHNA|nr:uncharacterized protein LOC115044116 [Echeneis naucrates]XP_029358826.1 uncharacterized protein LOC115044116 [Echeneis naucrates]
MSFTPNPILVPDRDSLPLKKRDQRPSSPSQQQQSDAATFKAPYPYKNHSEFKAKHTGPFQPVPRRVPALYQPWIQTHTSTRSKPHVLSAFREHHGWAEWREFNPLHPGWDISHSYQHHSPISGTPAVHPGQPHHPSRFCPPSLLFEGVHRTGAGYSWEQFKTLKETERQSSDRYKGPYVRRKDRKAEYFPRITKASPPLMSTCLPHSLHENQHDLSHKSTNNIRHHVSGHSFPDSNSTYTSTKDHTAKSFIPPSSEHASSSSPNQFPWLLPHFVAGSLIELRDGRLRRVEHLQTEDFLLGSLACPDLHLSCCTVQSISPSASSSLTSRLLFLLHDQQSQELVDVYVEYPFFVRGRGWSSCSPERTVRLCGLQCRQLSVGDVCLALTPVSTSQPTPSATLEPKTLLRKSEMGCEAIKVSHPQVPLGPQCLAGGQKKEGEAGRRRHYSAP